MEIPEKPHFTEENKAFRSLKGYFGKNQIYAKSLRNDYKGIKIEDVERKLKREAETKRQRGELAEDEPVEASTYEEQSTL